MAGFLGAFRSNYHYYFSRAELENKNESDTFPSRKPAAHGRPYARAASNAADDFHAVDEPSHLPTAIWLEPRNIADDATAIDASKFRSPGWLKAQRTTGAPPIGLRRKSAQGLLLAGPIQAREGVGLQRLPGDHQR